MSLKTTALIFTLFALQVLNSAVYAKSNVLLINSYHPQYRWSDEIMRGVKDALAPHVEPESLFIEFMDARRFIDDRAYEAKMIDLLKYKYQNNKPSVIITSDDTAFDFMLNQGNLLFPNTPVVFCGVNMFNQEKVKHRSDVTGITEGTAIAQNLALIKEVQPEVKRVIMLGDTTGLGLSLVNEAKQLQKQWQTDDKESSLILEFWDSFTMEQLYKDISQLPSDTVVFVLAVHKDNQGLYFSYEEHLPILSKHSSVPIYGMWGAVMIEHGIIGGMISDPYQHGFSTAEMAVRILNGDKAENIPIQPSAVYAPKFNYLQLQRFAIEETQLPTNSEIINKPISFYQQNKILVNTAVIIFTSLLLLIIALVINIRQRISAQARLRDFNLQLDKTVKERTLELRQRNKALEDASAKMKKLAHTDSLTGLLNRRSAEKKVSAYLKRFNVEFKPFVLVILDIDHFKQVNDNHGHLVGDQVLIAIAETLSMSLRPSDHVFRWGGEEFLLTLPEINIDEARSVLNRLANQIRMIKVDPVKNITASMGVSAFKPGDEFDSIVKRADDVLYEAKHSGRDRIMFACD